MDCLFLLQRMSENEVAQSCPTLFNPMDCSLPGSSVHGICQARVLEWVAIAFSHPYTTTGKTIALTGWTFVGKVMSLLFNMLSRFLIAFLPRSSEVKATQSCPTLCDPMAYTVHGIHARILEWGAFPF